MAARHWPIAAQRSDAVRRQTTSTSCRSPDAASAPFSSATLSQADPTATFSRAQAEAHRRLKTANVPGDRQLLALMQAVGIAAASEVRAPGELGRRLAKRPPAHPRVLRCEKSFSTNSRAARF